MEPVSVLALCTANVGDVLAYLYDMDVLQVAQTSAAVSRYMKSCCDPSKGIVLHAHPTHCALKTMSGLWQLMDTWEVAMFLQDMSRLKVLATYKLPNHKAVRALTTSMLMDLKTAEGPQELCSACFRFDGDAVMEFLNEGKLITFGV